MVSPASRPVMPVGTDPETWKKLLAQLEEWEAKNVGTGASKQGLPVIGGQGQQNTQTSFFDPDAPAGGANRPIIGGGRPTLPTTPQAPTQPSLVKTTTTEPLKEGGGGTTTTEPLKEGGGGEPPPGLVEGAGPVAGAGGEGVIPPIDPFKTLKPMTGDWAADAKQALSNLQQGLTHFDEAGNVLWLTAALTMGMPQLPPGYIWDNGRLRASTPAELGAVWDPVGTKETGPYWKDPDTNAPFVMPKVLSAAELAVLSQVEQAYMLRAVVAQRYTSATGQSADLAGEVAVLREEEAAGIRAEERQAIVFTGDPADTARAQVQGGLAFTSFNTALAQSSPDNFRILQNSFATLLPSPPSGFYWDADKGEFLTREGYGGRKMAEGVQEYLTAITSAYQARARAESVLAEYQKYQTDKARLVFERNDADARFKAAMETEEDIDSAEEALARQRMAATALDKKQMEMLPLTLLGNLMGSPIALAMAQETGLMDVLAGMVPGFKVPGWATLNRGATVVRLDGSVDTEAYARLGETDKQLAAFAWAKITGNPMDQFTQALGSTVPGSARGFTQTRSA